MATSKEKKKFLGSYRYLKIELATIEEEIKTVRAEMLPGALQYDGMPHGSGTNPDLSNYAVKVEGLLDRYRSIAAKRIEALDMIVKTIEAVESPKERIVLRCRYILMKKWEDIARIMGYADPRPVYRIHGKALNKLKIPDFCGKEEKMALESQ